jgi:anti-sigma regulatory factor (Ser/Thr protein kinase)
MSDRTSWSHDIDLDEDPVSASRARAFVRHHLEQHQLTPLSADVEVVVSELVTNAVRHARTPVAVSMHGFEQTLLLEVADGSSAWPLGVATAHLRDTHGRGLGIVGHLSRDWGMDALPPGGKSVWAEFSLPEHISLDRRETA